MEVGANQLVGTDKNKIVDALHQNDAISSERKFYGDGNAAKLIVSQLLKLNNY